MPLTEEQKAKREKARKARKEREDKLIKDLRDAQDTVKTMQEQIDGLKKQIDAFEGIDTKDILDKIESLKAQQETVRQQIRRDKGGLYIPGIEDEGKDFSMLKAIVGSASNWGMYKDTKEYEVVKQTTEVARNAAGIDSEGGWFIPDQVIPDVIGAIYEDSVMLALDNASGRTRVSLITGLTGAKVRIPKFNSGMIAYWIGEKKPYTTSEPSVGTVTMDPKKLGLAATITDEMANRATYGFDALLRNDMRRVAAAEIDRVVLYGNGTDFEPRGIINDPDITQFYFESGNGTAPTGTPVGARSSWSKMNLLQLLLENQKIQADSSAAWISSPSYFRDLANLRTLNFSGQDEETAPFLSMLPPLTMSALRDLLGDFASTTQIPANNTIASSGSGADQTFTDLFYGNWNNVVVGRWGGLEIISDQGLAGDNWWKDLQSVKMRMYMDIVIRWVEALTFARDVRLFTNPS